MNSRILQVVLFVLFFSVNSYAGPLQDCKQHVKYGVPSEGQTLLCRKGYLVSHDDNLKITRWVAYRLTKKMASGTLERKGSFRSDPELKSIGAKKKDYDKSGYDIGHMYPAADGAWDVQAMKDSFYFSNAAPQLAALNRGVWERLEKKVREWAKERDEIFVYAGPIITSTRVRTIPGTSVAIPTHFFKIVYDPKSKEVLGFVFPHTTNVRGTKAEKYIKSIDLIERITGMDFLSELSDDLEDNLESVIPEMWN